MQTRRHFLQEISWWSTVTGLAAGGFLKPIQRAFAIEPERGSTWLDAEHVVILMQENRSFDHSFGTLRGVRGFNDPRAIELPNGVPVWSQSNSKGETYLPFHLDIKESKSTWMGCLPHGWTDQVDAANGGLHNRWLDTKRSGNADYADLPLTLGYHTRADIPFYYALADAFTIADQNFCSTLTGTTPNRLHLWTGTIRENTDPTTPALVRNEDCEYGNWCSWRTFPELLEANDVSWKIYQNELTVPNGLGGEANAWLGNFGCNPLEWFLQYGVRYTPKHREYLARTIGSHTAELASIAPKLETEQGESLAKLKKRAAQLKEALPRLKEDLKHFTDAQFEKLTSLQKNLFEKALVTNQGDPHYRELAPFTYQEGDETRKVWAPKGDVLFQFRKDVSEGKLPTVSWLVPPERFSDHPCSAWYGQWYLSEVLNILTHNPDVWRKTIFILTYDENDGYFDHVPPFQAPHPQKPESGKASEGLDTTLEHLELEVDRKHKPGRAVRGNSLGLGFRVPMIIASPWSRGGCVYSEVCDHTSPIQFLEKWISHKLKTEFKETNISDWRRAICADLTASFQDATDVTSGIAEYTDRDRWLELIDRARFKGTPQGFHPLSPDELEGLKKSNALLPKQESGTRKSCPLPYELVAEGTLSADRREIRITFQSKKERFQDRAAGAPFILYASTKDGLKVRHYTATAGSTVEEAFPISEFADGRYRLRIHGPNGFFREVQGDSHDPQVEFRLRELESGDIELQASDNDSSSGTGPQPTSISIVDHSYGAAPISVTLLAGETQPILIPSSHSECWYDFTIRIASHPHFLKRYAGRVETGRWSRTDPAMA